MRVVVLAALFLATGSAAPGAAAPPVPAPPGPARDGAPSVRTLPRTTSSGAECRDPFRVVPADGLEAPSSQRLGELPPGDTLLAVHRMTPDGCLDPLIIRYGDGRGPARAAPEPVRPESRLYR